MKDAEDPSENAASSGGDLDSEYTPEGESKKSVAHKRSVKLYQNKWTLTAVILFIGAAISAAFIAIGWSGASNESEYNFVQRATEITFSFETAWHDYEIFGLWIHESCHKPFRKGDLVLGEDPGAALGFCSRKEFRKIYEYIISDGLNLQAAEFLPNITHDVRPFIEAEAQAYYEQNYPTVNYQGVTQLNPPPVTPKIGPSDDKDFYVPVHHVEPVLTNEAAVELDLYSSDVRRKAIDSAMESWEPVLSDRLKLVQETDPSAYSILLFHPGTNTSVEEASRPSALSLMVIRVPDLLERATKTLQSNEEVYVFDSTYAPEELPSYLGAVRVDRRDDQGVVEAIPELDLASVRDQPRGSQYYETDLTIADRKWTIGVVSPNEQPDLRFVILGGVFIFLACALVAVWFHHHLKVATKMQNTQTILSSLFPKRVQDQLMEDARQKQMGKDTKSAKESAFRHNNSGTDLKSFLGDQDNTMIQMPSSKPIAELYPETSILFGDICGFTSWSSTREPTAVFQLLETVYASFDALAKRRKVFKVETVGDCYVAVSGLPEARKDHAVCMARFARDCLEHFVVLMRRLECELGPDTADLGIRIGIHSGPVTSGVLRGDRPRFQLFGDSMNTASRLETTGFKNRIHVSKETAELLTEAGKGHWLHKRDDQVQAKGKGLMETFWLDSKPGDIQSTVSGRGSSESTSVEGLGNAMDQGATSAAAASAIAKENAEAKRDRLVDWNTSTLAKLLKAIAARRQAVGSSPDADGILLNLERESTQTVGSGSTVLDETVEVIEFPDFDPVVARRQKEYSPESVELGELVQTQLTNYISTIAKLYRDNGFHNYEHATHVIQSTTKLLSRIVAPTYILTMEQNADEYSKNLHEQTYGITSDPLTQFAVVFAALIHDTDHQGVPNATLIQEESPLAKVYQNKSVAEQNSVDIAWTLLMQEEYIDLRRTIYHTAADFKRFRQLVVNIVMATDIMDKKLGAMRKERWAKAFAVTPASSRSYDDKDMTCRKATIVMEHLIQASDVSHTMQHWLVYRKWNHRLFTELYKAYKDGRSDTNPADRWFEGELGFFDYYIIPLAKKLADCGVFGVSSDEYLQYAETNRREWENKGKELTAQMVEACEVERQQQQQLQSSYRITV